MVAGVTDALSVARADVAAALTAGLAAVLPAHRVHPVVPPKPVTPMVWLGPFGLQPDTIGGGAIAVVAIAGTVLAPVDGRAASQITATDLLQAAIWQALNTVANPTASTVGPIDVGGPLLYGVTATFTMVVAAASICPLELITTTGGAP